MPTLPNAEDLGTRPIPQSNREIAVVRNAGAVGQAVSELGATASHVLTQLEDMHNEDDARRLDIAHAEAARKIRTEAEQAQGMNAAAARTAASEQMQALNADILSRARSRAVRDALTPLIARRAGVEMDSVGEHALRQTTASMEAAMTSRRDMAIQEAQEHYDNPEAVESGINTARTEIANHGRWRGADAATVAVEQFAATSQIRGAVVERMAGTGDYAGALRYLDAHSPEIDHAREQSLRLMLRGPLNEDAAEAIVDHLPAITGQPAGTSPAPVQPARPGNIDLASRPTVQNSDGTVSTIRSISIGTDQGEVLIPTVVNGRVVSNEQAVAHYRETGENLGVFQNAADADRYAQWLHEREAQRVAAPASTHPARAAPVNEGNQPARFSVDGWTVGDGYGAQRQGHIHQGIDIFNAAGAAFPVGRDFDITESHRQTSGTGAGGNIARVRFQDGSEWFAMHLPDLPAAGHYQAGATVLRAGNTGNASGTEAHIHWQPANAIAQAIYNQGRHEVAAYLTGGDASTASAGQVTPTGQRIDYTAARSQIETMNLPRDLRRAAITALERRISVEDSIRTRAGQDAESAITQRLVEIQAGGGRLTSITQIDPALIRQATQYRPQVVAELQRQIEENNRPHEPPANSPAFMALITQAATDPNTFLTVNPELLRGRITDGEVEQVTRMRLDIANRTGPQPSAIMGVIQRVLPSTGMIPEVPTDARTVARRQATEQARQVRENLTGRLLSAVSARLHRDHGQAPVTEEDILRAVQAEVTQVNVAGQAMRVFEAQERGFNRYSVTIPRQAVPLVDEALRRAGLPITENNRASLYLEHREQFNDLAVPMWRAVGAAAGRMR